jgi:Arc/MetJ family transcription regulator
MIPEMCILSINIHIAKGGFMRTNIVIDDKLMDLALKTTGLKTKKEVVEEGLKALIQIQQQKQLKSLRGKLHWDGDLEKMRSDS